MSASVFVGSLRLDVPLVNASGVIDHVSDVDDWNLPASVLGVLGAFVTKTITARPRAGNPQPWAETMAPAGTLVNAAGLPNPGIDRVIVEWANLPDALGVPVIASIGGDVDSLPELARRLHDASWASAIELNLSCPNVDGGLVASDAAAVERAVTAVRSATNLPLLAKLTPACGAPASVARAAQAAGADALTCCNTMPVRAFASDGSPLLGAGADGGLSGTGLHPISVRVVAQVADAVDLPVVGLGGVDSIAAARRMLDAGARIVGVGTGALFDPGLIADLARTLATDKSSTAR